MKCEVYFMAERINQHRNPLVGTNIRRLRKERKMKAVDVIAQLQLRGVYVTTGIFSKVEHGLNNPSVDMLIALTEVFQCDFNEFFEQEK
jgi:transcriptional regulator with XRE-family HTH domain